MVPISNKSQSNNPNSHCYTFYHSGGHKSGTILPLNLYFRHLKLLGSTLSWKSVKLDKSIISNASTRYFQMVPIYSPHWLTIIRVLCALIHFYEKWKILPKKKKINEKTFSVQWLSRWYSWKLFNERIQWNWFKRSPRPCLHLNHTHFLHHKSSSQSENVTIPISSQLKMTCFRVQIENGKPNVH